ncbi:MAG: MFS transporter [Gammaproteobacteria bacterium]
MWRVVAFGFLLNLSSAFGQTHFISLFNAQLRDSFALSHGEIGALYSAATLCSAAVLPWAGKLIDAADLRRYAAAVVCGLGFAAILLSFAEAAWHLAFAFFCLRLFGQGLSSHTGITTTARLATKSRGKSLGVAGLGMSVGEALAPPLVAASLMYLQWREVWQGAALAQFAVVLLASQWLLRGLPSAPPAHSSADGGNDSWTRGQVLRDSRFWLAAPAIFAPPCVVTALFFHQFGLAEYKGIDFLPWTAGVAAYSAGSVLASLTAGVLTDKFGGARVVKWMLAPLILSVLLPAWADFPGLSFVYYGLMGMSAGIGVPSVNALWVEMYGRAHLGAVRALAQAMVVLFSAIGPAAYGLLLDAGISWTAILLWTAAWMFAASLVLRAVPLQFRASGGGK